MSSGFAFLALVLHLEISFPPTPLPVTLSFPPAHFPSPSPLSELLTRRYPSINCWESIYSACVCVCALSHWHCFYMQAYLCQCAYISVNVSVSLQNASLYFKMYLFFCLYWTIFIIIRVHNSSTLLQLSAFTLHQLNKALRSLSLLSLCLVRPDQLGSDDSFVSDISPTALSTSHSHKSCTCAELSSCGVKPSLWSASGSYLRRGTRIGSMTDDF